MLKFAYENVPYYHKLFKKLNLTPDDFHKIEDLEKLPILTKEIIKENWDDFKPANLKKIRYYNFSTGGTSGTPLKYRISKIDRFLGGALQYRGWGYAGYELGDKVVFLGGSSLDIRTKSEINKKLQETARCLKKLSSFKMGKDEMNEYVKTINDFKPKFIRGYPSAISLLAEHLDENNLSVHQLSSIFTTSEKLYPHVKHKIETVFNCDVYDNYGLNDSGVSAYECSEHNGLHIDTKRSVMEIVDENGSQMSEGSGNVLGTSLFNYSMPFIRYQTGDMGYIIEDKCACGRGSKLLKEVIGRTVDILVTPEGEFVHGWFFLYIMWEDCKGVKEYQVIQEKQDKIVIKIVSEEGFDENQLNKIRDVIKRKSENWNIEFEFVDKIDRSAAGKYKFIINNLNKQNNS
jgi:phenylacetate-CoA ligase